MQLLHAAGAQANKLPDSMDAGALGNRPINNNVEGGEENSQVGYICLERGADFHTTQLMPLPLTVFCFSELVLPFWYRPAHPGSPGKSAVKQVCVCVCVCHDLNDLLFCVILSCLACVLPPPLGCRGRFVSFDSLISFYCCFRLMTDYVVRRPLSPGSAS